MSEAGKLGQHGVSIVVPVYNPGAKLQASLRSLAAIGPDVTHEVIFVDDVSTDGTFETLVRIADEHENWAVLRAPSNSGSPSRPRNIGIGAARGKYVLFLDADDEICADELIHFVSAAEDADVDVVRGYLIRADNVGRKVLNRIPAFPHSLDTRGRFAEIFAKQSTTVPTLIRRDLLVGQGIAWPEELRMGEDTVFLARVAAAARSVEYVDRPMFIYNTSVDAGEKSSTQSYGDRELREHLRVWSSVSESLKAIGIDYFGLRGQVAVQHSMTMLLWYYRGDLREQTFLDAQEFLSAHRAAIGRWNLRDRLRGILKELLDGSFGTFVAEIRPRLVIAGYDLKFLRGAVAALGAHFHVAVDEWTGHETHDETRSARLLAWADVVHCEWLLGNAVWYSQRVQSHQRLLVRLHLFEIGRSYGDLVNRDAIDAIITVSVPTTEEMQSRFNFDRRKIRVIPNLIDVASYSQGGGDERRFTLAMVGIVPRRKGFLRALEMLGELRRVDPRYRLLIFGKNYTEFPWLLREDAEHQYYRACEKVIAANALGESVTFRGWSNLKTDLAEAGIVLSLSDFESFHVAPAEAFAAGNLALFRRWPGVEYIYPEQYIFDSEVDLRRKVLQLRDPDVFESYRQAGAKHVIQRFDLPNFVEAYRDVVRSLPLREL